ncbi:MAG: hypothetical protein KJ041_06690 [Gammaproteobacteria bacterium]|nr:hypothetical protein [Gammaproteobacteria bacterium]
MTDSSVKTYKRRPPLRLRAGDWVVVRSKEEILATLDERARLDNLPFQPEMFAHCGQRMRVAAVAHKTCDTVNKTGGRSMTRAVHLEQGRCDGSAHGGCQADCVFFWKDDWLRRADDTSREPAAPAGVCTEELVNRRAKSPGDENSPDPSFVCQTTALYEATELLHWWDFRQYIRDVTSGNHSAWHMFKLLVFAGYYKLVSLGIGDRALVGFYNAFQRLRGGQPFPVSVGAIPDGKPTPTEILDLQPGELVEVKSGDEIIATITRNGFNRGMRYDMEMLKYSGQRYRVQMRVSRLINEQTGKMMEMKNPCIQLEDVYCRAECTAMRLGCPRASNTYWREIWLRRVADEKNGGPRPAAS